MFHAALLPCNLYWPLLHMPMLIFCLVRLQEMQYSLNLHLNARLAPRGNRTAVRAAVSTQPPPPPPPSTNGMAHVRGVAVTVMAVGGACASICSAPYPLYSTYFTVQQLEKDMKKVMKKLCID